MGIDNKLTWGVHCAGSVSARFVTVHLLVGLAGAVCRHAQVPQKLSSCPFNWTAASCKIVAGGGADAACSTASSSWLPLTGRPGRGSPVPQLQIIRADAQG